LKETEEKESDANFYKRINERIYKMEQLLTYGKQYLIDTKFTFELAKTFKNIPYEKILCYECEKLEKKMPTVVANWKKLHPEIYPMNVALSGEIVHFFAANEVKNSLLVRDMSFFKQVKRNERKYFYYKELFDKVMYEETKEFLSRADRHMIFHNITTFQIMSNRGKLSIDYNKIMNANLHSLKKAVEETCKKAILLDSTFLKLKEDLISYRKKNEAEYLLKLTKEFNTAEKEKAIYFARVKGLSIAAGTDIKTYRTLEYPYVINYEYEKIEKHYPKIIEEWKNQNKTVEK